MRPPTQARHRPSRPTRPRPSRRRSNRVRPADVFLVGGHDESPEARRRRVRGRRRRRLRRQRAHRHRAERQPRPGLRARGPGEAGVKVVAAGDEVPITKYATQLVKNLAKVSGYPADFQAAYDRNVVSKEDNVKSVVAKVELGEGDAGIVYATDALASKDVDTCRSPTGERPGHVRRCRREGLSRCRCCESVPRLARGSRRPGDPEAVRLPAAARMTAAVRSNGSTARGRTPEASKAGSRRAQHPGPRWSVRGLPGAAYRHVDRAGDRSMAPLSRSPERRRSWQRSP